MAIQEIQQNDWFPMIIGGENIEAIVADVESHALPGERVCDVRPVPLSQVIHVETLPDTNN